METAVGTAQLLVDRVLAKLSDDLVAAFAASSQLGLNFSKIKEDLMLTAAMLHVAQERTISDNPGLQGLLAQLSSKADEAEIALDELHYFMIQDQLDGTIKVVPDLDRGIRGHADHGGHAARRAIGNWLPLFSCSCIKNPQKETKSDSGGHVDALTLDHVDVLTFDRVSMSMKIKLVTESINILCAAVSDLLKIVAATDSSTTVGLKRPLVGSTISQDRLYGREDIFEKTINCITSSCETLSILPIHGPGGIGKSTLTQHLYNDKRTRQHFSVRVWISVSTEFNVLKLTQQILRCIPATEEESNTAHETNSLSNIQEYIALRLRSKRFLIILDDVWKCDSEGEWKTLLAPFTKGEAKGSMILVTTRFPKLAEMMKTVDPLELQGLEPNDFFTFFEACIFGELDKPEHYKDILSGIAREIADELKGYPLAAKTVSRLLRKDISQEHWMGVLGNKEWENRQNNEDIMSSLNTSYDYLPFLLQKCFSYCSLFPKGHRFTHLEINRILIALGIIDSTHGGDNNYLEDLVDNGFLVKGDDLIGQNYIMHNLLHGLSRSVSAQECLNISGLDFKADTVPQSIRHLSITIEEIDDENFLQEMSKLKTRIDIANLRTLMIFREYEGKIAEILKDTFKELNNLNVLFIVVKSLDDLPQNFSKLIHLQYLKLGSSYGIQMALPSTLSRFYHLKFLDLEDWNGSSNLPKDISRLMNLHDFLAKKELHSNVPMVEKMQCLRELKEFCVKESTGFELTEVGALTELGGKLRICNLENVLTKEEASSARLMSKRNLGELTLVWGKGQQPTGSDILDDLRPHTNLRALGIINHGGTAGPSWLCLDISVKNLESLHLEGISWGTLPPFGQLRHLKELSLKSISGLHQLRSDYGFGEGKSFIHLKKTVFDDMPELEEWVVEPDSQLFPSLESNECRGCPNLYVMPFSKLSCPNLCSVLIDDCPKLYLLPMPLSSTLSVVESSSRKLTYSQKVLVVRGCNGSLDFGNLDGSVVFRSVQNEEHVERVIQFPSSSSLQTLSISSCTDMVLVLAEEERGIQGMESLQSITILRCGKLFSQWLMGEAQTMKPFPPSLKKLGISSESSIQSMALLSNLTSLTHLTLQDCVKLTVDGFNPLITVNLKALVVFNCRWDRSCPESIAADLLSEVASRRVMPAGSFRLEQLKVDSISAVLVAPICNLVASTFHTLIFCHDHRTKSFTEEQEKALQLLTSLRHLEFDGCGALQSLPRGLNHLSSLEDLEVLWCPEIQSIPKEGFPVSL